MKIRWFGHSCFLLQPDLGSPKVLTDPFDESVGYPIPNLSVDIITESHQHFDHNAHRLIRGNYTLIKTPGEFEIAGVKILGVPTYHDKSMGRERGKNIIFKFNFPEEIVVAHLGDLGHVLDEKTARLLTDVNILLIPVGGYFTIGAEEAKKICDQLKPNLIIPMHYKTKYLNFPIEPVNGFVRYFEKTRKVGNLIELKKEDILNMDSEVWVMSI